MEDMPRQQPAHWGQQWKLAKKFNSRRWGKLSNAPLWHVGKGIGP
jgi:hypothetical protein